MADDFRGAEGVHWYASPRTVEMGCAQWVGQPIDEVPSSDGKNRVRPNVTHALKYGLAAGVTSILGQLQKPQLIDWACRQGARAAVYGDHPTATCSFADWFQAGNWTEKEYLDACLDFKDKVKQDAADGGSEIHKWLELGFNGVVLDDEEGIAQECFETVKQLLDETYPGVTEWVAEKPCYHPLGFGARTDILGWYSNKNGLVVVDFKTREFVADDVVKAKAMRAKGNKTFGRLTPYETEPMQIAANLHGHMSAEFNGKITFGDNEPFSPLKEVGFYGGNLYISRTNPSLVHMHKYTSEELSKAWEAFKCLKKLHEIQKGITGR